MFVSQFLAIVVLVPHGAGYSVLYRRLIFLNVALEGPVLNVIHFV